jgi:hypothetical protein
MTRRGRPVRGAIWGLIAGGLVGLDLAIFDVVPLGTLTTVILPLAGLALGLIIGLTGPFGRRPAPRSSAPSTAPPPTT